MVHQVSRLHAPVQRCPRIRGRDPRIVATITQRTEKFGWTPDAVFAPGGTDEGNFVVWRAAYSIAGNGTTATRGLITQPAVTDSLGAPLIQANTDYTVRARCARNALLLQGTLHIHLFSSIGGINTTGLQLSAAQLTTGYVEYSAQLTAPLAIIPGDLVLRVYADGTPNQNGQFYIDCLEIFPTAQPVNASLVRASRVEDPESYDGIEGLLSVLVLADSRSNSSTSISFEKISIGTSTSTGPGRPLSASANAFSMISGNK